MKAVRDCSAPGGDPATRSSCYVILSLVLLLAGCASLPEDYTRTETVAFPDHLDTSIGRLFETAAKEHPG
ncbi:MAG: hypothetical protein ACR2Q4_14785, partial [Geminicoccaceae bacterium]